MAGFGLEKKWPAGALEKRGAPGRKRGLEQDSLEEERPIFKESERSSYKGRGDRRRRRPCCQRRGTSNVEGRFSRCMIWGLQRESGQMSREKEKEMKNTGRVSPAQKGKGGGRALQKGKGGGRMTRSRPEATRVMGKGKDHPPGGKKFNRSGGTGRGHGCLSSGEKKG